MPDTNVVTPLRPASSPPKKADPTNQLRQRRHRAKKKTVRAVTPPAPTVPLARAKKPSEAKALLTPLRRANRISRPMRRQLTAALAATGVAGILTVLRARGPAGSNVPASLGQASYDPDVFNVRSFDAAGDGQTDDSAAIASAAAAAVANSLRGQPSALYFPSGTCRLVTTLPTWTVPISVFGDGQARSVIRVDPAFSGDVFSWSDVWAANNYGADTISSLTKQKSRCGSQGNPDHRQSHVGQRPERLRVL